MFVLLALVLLTATTIGDEFGWGTIRTTLLGSSHRWRILLVRLGALWLTVAALISSAPARRHGRAARSSGVAIGRCRAVPPVDSGALAILSRQMLLALPR